MGGNLVEISFFFSYCKLTLKKISQILQLKEKGDEKLKYNKGGKVLFFLFLSLNFLGRSVFSSDPPSEFTNGFFLEGLRKDKTFQSSTHAICINTTNRSEYDRYIKDGVS